MIQVQSTTPREKLEEEVDVELASFDTWFQATLNNGPLVNSERAIVKTYLAWKLGVKDGA